ncbi:L-glyceraldehyde 3-phosphate reductase [Providencia rettgeri]|nr:L-glyceraldehyde 3-phosphate reductase [Providencia rettgeri]CAC9109629.1 L-glyceraldehyde 3-phosphate reductase [Providencia rettgeri]
MALAWLLRHDRITSVLIGASRISQIDDAMGILKNRNFTQDELKAIELILENE